MEDVSDETEQRAASKNRKKSNEQRRRNQKKNEREKKGLKKWRMGSVDGNGEMRDTKRK